MSTSAERMRRKRLFDAGYEGKPCPEGLHWREQVPWAEGVWKRQAEMMPTPDRRPLPKELKTRGRR